MGANASAIVLDSTECPELGPHVCKMPISAPGFEAYFVDHGAFCGDHIIFSLRFRALTHGPVSSWGEGVWTSAMQIFSAYIDSPYWQNWGAVVDGRCRAKDEAGQNSRVVEFSGVADALNGTVDVEDHGLYTLDCELTRNPSTGVFACRGQIRIMGTPTVVGSKSWTMQGASPAPIPSNLEFGIRSLGQYVPTPQDVFFSNLVIDTSADGVYPIKDYYDTYQVAFASQGGSSVSPETVTAGGHATEPTAPTRTGYTFGGWYREAECTTAWNFLTDTVTADVTLYAKWTVISYTVSFDSLGGSSVASQSVAFGGHASAPTAPTRDRYSFGGWYTEEACTNAWDFSTGTIMAALMLYAKWTLQSHRITFDSQGGSSAAAEDVGVGDPIGTIPTPYRPGFIFRGWFTQASGAGVQISAATVPTADITVYAYWASSSAKAAASMAPADVRDLLEGYCLDTTASVLRSGDLVLGSVVVDGIDASGLQLYMKVSGAGVPAGAIVSDVDQDNSRIEISLPASASGSDVPLTFTRYDQMSDAWLTKARDEMVLPWMERKLGFPLSGSVGRVTEYRSGTGSSIVVLSRRPVLEVHSINLVTNPSNWVYVSPTSVEVVGGEGILKLRTVLEAWTSYVPAFPRGKYNIKVDYSNGFATVPDELVRAVNNLVASLALAHIGARTGGGSVSVPGISRSYGQRGKYEDIRTELERWAYAAMKGYMSGNKGS